MAGTLYSTNDTAKLIGQSIRNGYVFREYTAMHPLAGILVGDATEVMYDQGKKLDFERLSVVNGDGPRFHVDVSSKTAAPLVLGSTSANGEGAPTSFNFTQPTKSIQTGWAAFKIASTIYESEMVTQKGQYLLTETSAETEGRRMQEALMVQLSQSLYGDALPAKNSFGGLRALVSDGLDSSTRGGLDSTRSGTAEEGAYAVYGVDSSTEANWRSYVQPWTTTIPTVASMVSKVEKVRATTSGMPYNILMGVANYQTQRDSVDTTNGAIVTNLNTKRQELGITGFTYRGVDFIMDPDVDNYASANMFGIDPKPFTFHMNENVMGNKTYERLTGILNAAWYKEWIVYFQLTLGSRRKQIKWVQY